MPFERSSGLLLHITSLPSYGGIGDFGPAAYAFADFLAEAKQRLWQVLPLSPTGYGNSPYAALSAFAGNPLLISLEYLSQW
jgi:4-alpha-glucanotransferase